MANPAPNSKKYLVSESQTDAVFHLKTGKKLYMQYLSRAHETDLKLAIRHFQQALELEPNLPEAYIKLASALWEQGSIQIELAQFYCQTALQLNPKSAEAYLYLGYFMQHSGAYYEAMAHYQTSAQLDFVHSGRARIAYAHLALKTLAAKKSVPEKLVQGLTALGQFVVGTGMLAFDSHALTILKSALLNDFQMLALGNLAKLSLKFKCYALGETCFKIGTQWFAEDAYFYHLLSDFYLFDAKQAPKARPVLEKLLSLEPNNPVVMKKLAKVYTDLHHTQDALDILHKALELQQDDFDILYQLGHIYMEEKAFIRALYYFKESARVAPKHPYVHSNMAYVLFKLDDIEGALAEYQTAYSLGSDSSWLTTVAQTIGTIQYQIYDNKTEALHYLQHAIHHSSKNHEAVAMLADIYFELGQLDVALVAYRNLLKLCPDHPECYSNIGFILWQMDQNEEAVEAYLQAIHLDHENHIAHNNLGVIYLDDQNDPLQALPLFEKALTLMPNYTLACFNVGRAHHMLHQTDQAMFYYLRALDLNIVSPEVEPEEIESRLQQLFHVDP
jgi:tetratricopeptide (TPR) repeat protein